jgi:hypothetical protein
VLSDIAESGPSMGKQWEITQTCQIAVVMA